MISDNMRNKVIQTVSKRTKAKKNQNDDRRSEEERERTCRTNLGNISHDVDLFVCFFSEYFIGK